MSQFVAGAVVAMERKHFLITEITEGRPGEFTAQMRDTRGDGFRAVSIAKLEKDKATVVTGAEKYVGVYFNASDRASSLRAQTGLTEKQIKARDDEAAKLDKMAENAAGEMKKLGIKV